ILSFIDFRPAVWEEMRAQVCVNKIIKRGITPKVIDNFFSNHDQYTDDGDETPYQVSLISDQ
ncbi:MAG: hypothetical protein ABW185_10220, partial [Sedimenticola sp.]